MSTIEHGGTWWNKRNDGAIFRYDHTTQQWQQWEPGEGLSPPAAFTAAPPPPPPVASSVAPASAASPGNACSLCGTVNGALASRCGRCGNQLESTGQNGSRRTSSYGSLSNLHPEAARAMTENLAAGEEIRVVIRGAQKTQGLIATDRRVFVFKKGFMGGAWLGKKLASWDYANINGLILETGFSTGYIVVQAPGVPTVDTSYWKSGKSGVWEVPNAIPLAGNFPEAQQGVAIIRELIAAAQATKTAPKVLTSDPLDQLKKLADLRDAGVVTEEEFETKKKQLLSV